MSKVYVYNRHGGPETQELIDRAIPVPGPGELGVKVRAAAVNPVDWKLRSGRLGQNQELPAAMGREVAGTVTAVGDGVNGRAVGDEILGPVAPGQGAGATLVPYGDGALFSAARGRSRRGGPYPRPRRWRGTTRRRRTGHQLDQNHLRCGCHHR